MAMRTSGARPCVQQRVYNPAGVNPCVLSIENPQNRKENSPLSDREIPIIRKKHVESFRFFPYLVGKKAAFTAFCPIG